MARIKGADFFLTLTSQDPLALAQGSLQFPGVGDVYALVKNSSWRANLGQSLALDGNYEVAMVGFSALFRPGLSSSDPINLPLDQSINSLQSSAFVYLDIIEPQRVGSTSANLLYQVQNDTVGNRFSFKPPVLLYKPLAAHSFASIEVLVAMANGKPYQLVAPSNSNAAATSIELHFRPKRV